MTPTYFIFARKGDTLYVVERLLAHEAAEATQKLRAAGFTVKVSR